VISAASTAWLDDGAGESDPTQEAVFACGPTSPPRPRSAGTILRNAGPASR
jgi:hypothetical protein